MKTKTTEKKKASKATAKEKLTIKESIQIKASPHAVWNAITNPQMTRKYFFNTDVESDWHKGGVIQYRDNGGHIVVHGEIKTIEPGKSLELQIDVPVKDGVQHTTVKYNLEKSEHGTLLSISDGDFRGIEGGTVKYRQSVKGWKQALEGMKGVLEN